MSSMLGESHSMLPPRDCRSMRLLVGSIDEVHPARFHSRGCWLSRYAADGYARINGLASLVTTFGKLASSYGLIW